MPLFMKSLGVWSMDRCGWGAHYFREMLRRSSTGEPFFFSGAETFSDYRKQKLLSPRMRDAFKGRTSFEAVAEIWKRFEAGADEQSPLNWMSYVDLNLRLPELLLMRVDKMSMGVSLEARVPFLDHEVVSLAMSVPTEVKMRNGELKYLLKRAVAGLIPDEILRRPKQGFSVPVSEWLQGRLGEEARVELRNFCDQTDLLDRDVVDRMATRHPGQQVWYLLNFALWWRQFIAS